MVPPARRAGGPGTHRGMSIRPLLLACCASLILAAPASAVVGGEKIALTDVPWFAMVGGCGGTLVAPDRVVTAAHCLHRHRRSTGVTVGEQVRSVTGTAMHPGWRHRNGENYLDDVAIVQLAEPITNVAPAALGGSRCAPGADHRHRRASTRPATGTARPRRSRAAGCARRRCAASATPTARRPSRATRPPGASTSTPPACAARSTSTARPRSARAATATAAGRSSRAPTRRRSCSASSPWGGDYCGADHLPSVFMDVERYRDVHHRSGTDLGADSASSPSR